MRPSAVVAAAAWGPAALAAPVPDAAAAAAAYAACAAAAPGLPTAKAAAGKYVAYPA